MKILTLLAALVLTGSAFADSTNIASQKIPAGKWGEIIPADKNLPADWVQSLTERGTPTTYRGADLKYIGMPIGGICAGQLYLGGDGRLWHWDIFNDLMTTGSRHYSEPLPATYGLDQGFALRILSGAPQEIRTLDASGFPDVGFRGEYPVGKVTYTDSSFPLHITLEAFSPFVPLDVDNSSLPATVMKFTVKNTSSSRIEAELGGWLENAVVRKSGQLFPVMRTNRERNAHASSVLECGFREVVDALLIQERPKILFEDFEQDDWGKWTVVGEAFGAGPSEGTPRKEQRLSGFQGRRLANSYAARGDIAVGSLTSEPFKIERRFINFLIGGGNHMREDGDVEAGLILYVDGKVVRNATGINSDTMSLASWDVSELEGKMAVLKILDEVTAGWGHIEIDHIEFADQSPLLVGTASEQPDAGSLALGLLDATAMDRVNPLIQGEAPVRFFAPPEANEAERPPVMTKDNKLVGSVVRPFSLEPGESQEITFVLAWYFPNLVFPLTFHAGEAATDKTIVETGRYYGTKFDSALAVVDFVSRNRHSLVENTELWRDTWYDSTLPHWFLDRTLLNVAALASSTVQRFANGRFFGWEGVGSCGGTCTHVWSYEQAMGRLFPELDILLRERVDFNPQVGFNAQTGIIGFRGEIWPGARAADGQAGTILRTYRNYLVSPDEAFLKRNWPQIKLATEWLMSLDSDGDGILDKPQPNTLDGTWHGKIPWITSLALAAAEATAQMALVMGDKAFAETCKTFVQTGKANFVDTFWNGEYFQQIHDPTKLDHIGSYNGCLIDQVMGQGWAFQVGLDRVLPKEKTEQALHAIWKYNFAPDVGPFRERRPAGRWYAMAGEAATLMCSWPRGDELRVTQGFDKYFNESMNGFEYQVAGHMIWEGSPGSELVKQGLAIARAVHDRYHGSKRNPWNEIEAGDHYARSMASYGVFLAACGFEYDGPAGHIGFAPKLTPENFKAAFTAAEGWGSFSQKLEGGNLNAEIALKWGQLRLRSISLATDSAPASATVVANGKTIPAERTFADGTVTLTLSEDVILTAGQSLAVNVE